jgi:hypothetical protein
MTLIGRARGMASSVSDATSGARVKTAARVKTVRETIDRDRERQG